MPGGPYPGQVGSVTTYTTTTAGTPCDVFTATVDAANVLCYVPWSVTSGARQVWVSHGVGNDYIDIITSTTSGMHSNTTRDVILDGGYAIISLETPPPPSSQNSWGNNGMRSQYDSVWAWSRSIWPQTPGPFLYGISHGGVVSLNYLMEGNPVSAVYLNSPVTDLVFGYAHINSTEVLSAYGLSGGQGPGTTAWNNATAGHDPMVVPISSFPSVPFRFRVSNTDNTAPRDQNADVFKARLDAVPWALEDDVSVYIGAHTATPSYNGADTVAFFNRADPVYTSFTSYQLLVKTTGLPAQPAQYVKERGSIRALTWSASVPVTEPSEYVKPQGA